jgi:RHS repeat-associated protein
VTQIKQYADALSLDQDTAVVVTQTSDIAGNLRAQSFSCCEQTTITYTTNTQYAWPDSQTSGSPSDQTKQNTSSATYDYNTGLVLTSTDANDRDTVIDYDPNTLRPVRENLPTGAYQFHIYDDLNLSVSDFVYEAGQSGGNFASRSDTYLDGLGRVFKEATYGKDPTQAIMVSVVETKFDNLGRVSQQSRPYIADSFFMPVEPVEWSTVTYDSLDRPVQTISPDGSVVTRAYNQSPDPPGASGQLGQTVKVTDPCGRERWARGDELGRTVEVAEPNPDGSGALSGGAMYTTYSYDALGRLLQVNQGAQTRRFRYDSLGRLTHQKLAERDATLDAGGQWVGSGQWSDVFTYDKRSNVTQRVDARGVKMIFKYKDTGGNEDPLNRLLAVEYDKSGSPPHLRDNIPDAPNVSYGYMTTTPGDKMRAANIAVSNGMGNEQLSYDSEGRLSQVHQTFAGREGYPVVTNYIWDSLDRLKESVYPQQYGAGEIRKKVEPAYDIASRLESLKFGGVNFASNILYTSHGQMTSLDVGSQIKELYFHDYENGLMTQQQVKRGAEHLVDLKYNYTVNNDANNLGPKTGQLTGITDLKNTGRNRAYEYDKLGRLIKVKGGVNAVANPTWYQTYSYDRYGNRSLVQHTQLAMVPVNPGSQSRSDLIGKVGQGADGAANRIFSAAEPFATPGINESYGSIIADDDSVGTRVKGGPRVTEEEYRVKSRDVTEAGTGAISGSETEEEYRVKSGDAAGNLAASDDSTFTTPDITPLVIYNVATANITSTSAGIGWVTDELSQGQVEYGLTTAYGQFSSWSSFIDYGGGVVLTGLTPGTTYHYRVRVAGWEGGSVVSGDFTFTTLDAAPPVISNVAAGGITASKATITWTTNEASNSQVEYGLTQAYGQSTPIDPGLVTAHSLELSGLTPNTLYHYRVRSKKTAGNPAISDDFTFTTAQGAQIPLDGLASLSYNAANNQINTSGFAYDPAGNQTRAVIDASGTQQQYRYDCAGRLAQVLDAIGNVLAIYSYGAGNQRLMSVEGGVTRYFAWAGGQIIAEYEASGTNALIWRTSYVYLGGKLLATTSGTDGTETRFHHPDRLGTRLVTDAAGTVVSEQLSMPFGTMLPFTQAYGGENSYQHPTLSNPSKKRFTSYDRSDATGLDYAVNRFYSQQQGRFTQIDPIGMGAAELANPQSLNLYAYVENDPINSTDPLGLDGLTAVFRPFPTPPGNGGGGGLKIGPFGLSFSFGGGSFLKVASVD